MTTENMTKESMATENKEQNLQEAVIEAGIEAAIDDSQTIKDLLHLSAKGRGFYMKDVEESTVEVDLSLNDSITKEYEDFKIASRKLFAKIEDIDPTVLQYFREHGSWQAVEQQLIEKESDAVNRMDYIVAYDAIMTSAVLELVGISQTILGLDKQQAIINVANKLEDISAFLAFTDAVQQAPEQPEPEQLEQAEQTTEQEGDVNAE